MRRVVVAIALFLLATSATAQDWTLPSMEKQVLRLEVSDKNGNAGTCSSVVFNAASGLALTAAHCVKGDGVELTIGGKSGGVIRSNRLLDLAVIKYRPSDEVTVPFGKSPGLGTEVGIFGFGFGKKGLHGQFGRVARELDEDGYLVLNVDTIFGDSGGGVFDRKGRLVGIVSAVQSNGPAHYGLAIPSEVAKDFVFDLLPQPKAKTQ